MAKARQDDNPMAGCFALLMIIGFVVWFVSSWNSGDDDGPSDTSYEITLKREVRQLLRDPDSAEFKDTRVNRVGDVVVLCGEVNSKNGFGGMTGYQRFIAGGATVLEEQMAPSEFAQSWATFCT